MGVIFFEKKLLKNLAGKKKVHTFAVLLEARRALSSAGSERLPYKQRVGGSNPSAPTSFCLAVQRHKVSALERVKPPARDMAG